MLKSNVITATGLILALSQTFPAYGAGSQTRQAAQTSPACASTRKAEPVRAVSSDARSTLVAYASHPSQSVPDVDDDWVMDVDKAFRQVSDIKPARAATTKPAPARALKPVAQQPAPATPVSPPAAKADENWVMVTDQAAKPAAPASPSSKPAARVDDGWVMVTDQAPGHAAPAAPAPPQTKAVTKVEDDWVMDALSGKQEAQPKLVTQPQPSRPLTSRLEAVRAPQAEVQPKLVTQPLPMRPETPKLDTVQAPRADVQPKLATQAPPTRTPAPVAHTAWAPPAAAVQPRVETPFQPSLTPAARIDANWRPQAEKPAIQASQPPAVRPSAPVRDEDWGTVTDEASMMIAEALPLRPSIPGADTGAGMAPDELSNAAADEGNELKGIRVTAKTRTAGKNAIASSADDGAAQAVSESDKKSPESKKQLARLNDDDAPVSKGDAVTFAGGSNAGAATKAAGFLVGTILGTPVAMVRSAGVDWKRGTSELSGNSKNPVIRGAVGTVLLPYSAFSGLIQGPFYGFENAFKKQPFTKDAFCLGEDFQ